MAATADESTPPDMATAIVSGCVAPISPLSQFSPQSGETREPATSRLSRRVRPPPKRQIEQPEQQQGDNFRARNIPGPRPQIIQKGSARWLGSQIHVVRLEDVVERAHGRRVNVDAQHRPPYRSGPWPRLS